MRKLQLKMHSLLQGQMQQQYRALHPPKQCPLAAAAASVPVPCISSNSVMGMQFASGVCIGRLQAHLQQGLIPQNAGEPAEPKLAGPCQLGAGRSGSAAGSRRRPVAGRQLHAGCYLGGPGSRSFCLQAAEMPRRGWRTILGQSSFRGCTL